MNNEVETTVISELQRTFASGRTRSLKWRRQQLNAVHRMLISHRKEWEQALRADLGKSSFDTWTTEISQVAAEISHTRKHLKKWLRHDSARTPLSLQPGKSHIRHEPLGTVLIIAPWNYPLQLLLSPLVGAIAGGNCVVLKPSEVSRNVEQLFARLVPRYLDRSAIRVAVGGPETVNALIDSRPDKVFFTGSTAVGTLIAERCAGQLIPSVLELGGKSPVYVHRDTNLKKAARHIVWGKFMNAGQTCVAPDHVYVHRAVANRFARAVAREIRSQFGRNPRKSKDFGRIITVRHAERLAKMITRNEVYHGGETDPQSRFIAPTVLFPVTETHPSMKEEIFGPVLPILPVSGPKEAVERINSREKPLALYVFAKSKKTQRLVLAEAQSGGTAINTTLMHLSTPYLPFGGVGHSGWGNYHGDWSFSAFTHERAVFTKATCFDTVKLIKPPASPVVKTVVQKTLLPAGKKRRR